MTIAMRVETEDGKTHNQPHIPNWRQYLEKIKRELTWHRDLSESKSLLQSPLSTPGSQKANNIEQKIICDVRCMAQMWRRMYPVNRCRNFGGRGHARSTFINHLKTHRHIFLTNDIERTRVLQSTTTFFDQRCRNFCGRLSASASDRSLCKVCSKKTPELTVRK